ncbi:MAG: translation initiation factor IF-2 [Opitutales bacterium]|nr:translation initiation factor IF-2 [Opitutales bacterium]
MNFKPRDFVKDHFSKSATYKKLQAKHFVEWLNIIGEKGLIAPTDPKQTSDVSWWGEAGKDDKETAKIIKKDFLAWFDEKYPELLPKKKTAAKKTSSKSKSKESSASAADEPREVKEAAPEENSIPETENDDVKPEDNSVTEKNTLPPIAASAEQSEAAPVAPAPIPVPVARPVAPAPIPVPVARPVAPAPIPVPAARPVAPAPIPVPAARPVAPAPIPVPVARPVAPAPIPVPAARPVAPAPRQIMPEAEIHREPSAPKVPSAAHRIANLANAKPEYTEAEKKKVTLRAPVIVKDMAVALGLQTFRIIKVAMNMNVFASVSTVLEDDVAIKIGDRLGFIIDIRRRGEKPSLAQVVPPKPAPVDETKDLAPRPPVVCVMGHVDHGKTTLLDYYRKSNVTAGEAGGITQHVAAYSVKHGDKTITFLDTPGHAAFSKMRERGAALTDIAVLVVAADDGFMPQTDEALKFAQKSNVQLVVAINKVDAKGANVDRVKQQMQKRGIASEDWGGEIQTEAVSALKGVNMDGLLDAILLQAEMMELKANPKCAVEGTVVEAQMEQGRGPTATVIVQRGTLKQGDALVCGQFSCRVRAIFDEYNKPLKSIAPGCPGRVMGWSGVPSAGAIFTGVKNPREAERIAEENALALRKAIEEQQAEDAQEDALAASGGNGKKMSDLAALDALLAGNSEKVFKVFTKADVDGTLEALDAALESIKSTKVKLEIVGGSVGPITPSEVAAAEAAKATIVAFDVKPANGVPALLKQKGVPLISHDIIYFLLDNVKDAMADLLDPVFRENIVGRAECRKVLELSKLTVAGSMVISGYVHRDYSARLIRGKEVLHTGRIDTLKRFKDDVTEVKEGYECGICITGFDKYQEGDIIECFEMLKERQTL